MNEIPQKSLHRILMFMTGYYSMPQSKELLIEFKKQIELHLSIHII